MSAAAVLLNLTGKINFEVTDPLLSVVNAEKPLLFYDRLSVEKFPTDATRCQQHVEHLVSSMRNMLEARSLSTKDQNETVRLIVVLDLVGGAFQPEDESLKVFPAQKVREFRNIVTRVFEDNNPYLNRFEYDFVFLVDNTEDQEKSNFFRELAGDGYSGVAEDKWIGINTIKLNEERDRIIQTELHDETPLGDNSIASQYAKFEEHLREVLERVGARMEEAGVGSDFKELFSKQVQGVTTVGAFRQFDYDKTILWCVSQLIGLNVDHFSDDCAFFIVGIERNTVAVRRRSEMVVASLIQLLSTLSPDDYVHLFNPTDLNIPAKLFVMGNPGNADLDVEAFSQLEKMVRASAPELEKARWKMDRKVKYKVYKPKNEDPQAIDAHREINDLNDEQRQILYSEFENTRVVPFFFGKRIGDWSWYKRVVRSAEEVHHFESVNDRPLYDPPKRLTDNEMDFEEPEASYAQLENLLETMPKEAQKKEEERERERTRKPMDLNGYIIERHKLMEKFASGIEDLKKEMVKLGYFTCLLWIGIFSAIGFTLCYAYHFFWFDNEDSLWYIAACFGVAAILFVLSAVIGRSSVKSRIKAVHSRMDSAYIKMQKNLKDYLEDINERVKRQNEADVLRRNLDEISSKLEAFYRHNKQVDLWINHYQGIVTKLSTTFQLLGFKESDSGVKVDNLDMNDFELETTMPSLPEVVTGQFGEMSIEFGNQGIPINKVTCFVRRFRFSDAGQ